MFLLILRNSLLQSILPCHIDLSFWLSVTFLVGSICFPFSKVFQIRSHTLSTLHTSIVSVSSAHSSSIFYSNSFHFPLSILSLSIIFFLGSSLYSFHVISVISFSTLRISNIL